MTAADRPSVTDNARAEAERRYGTPRESDLLPSDYVTIGQIEGYVEGRRAAGRAETTTEPRSCLPSLGDRCGNCHRCTDPAETTTATTEDAVTEVARLIDSCIPDDVPGYRYRYAVKAAEAMAARGLLATARTRPTREQIARAIDDEDTTPCAVCDDDWCYYCRADALRVADAVLALLEGGGDR